MTKEKHPASDATVHEPFNMGKTNRAALALAPREKILAEYDKLYKLCVNLEAIIENSQDSLFVTNGDAIIVKVNKAYEKLSGENREDLLGLNMRDLEGTRFSKSSTLRALEKKNRSPSSRPSSKPTAPPTSPPRRYLTATAISSWPSATTATSRKSPR